MFKGSIEEAEAEAERLLSEVAPGSFCVAQEWANRIDCVLKLADGAVVGEMVGVSELTEKRIREAGERLRQRSEGIEVPLVNELHAPMRITRSPPR